MFTVQYGGKRGKRVRLALSAELMAVRTHSRNAVEKTPLSREAHALVGRMNTVFRLPDAGVDVLGAVEPRQARKIRDRARSVLKAEADVRFAGRVLCDPASRLPVLYTENLFVKFDDDRAAGSCRRLLRNYGLEVKRELPYARNAFFVGSPEGTGLEVFDLSSRLLGEESVEFCHPELIREAARRAAFPQQWHLKPTTVNGSVVDNHAHVEAAWAWTEGKGATIAIIDDGVDLDHEEFAGVGKIVAPRDATRKNDNPRPGSRDDHGTACAGVACADGRVGASGVAPKARLMPIRLASALGSQDEADAIVWAAQHGADTISCSWGPVDGAWWDPNDPRHQQVVPLPDSTRLAIDWAVQHGRNGKGCIITWAAGNGNESVDIDGYASYDKVIAVAACNDGGKRSAYSDIGQAIWCAFPSNDVVPAKTPGIWTTDRMGVPGYNPGRLTDGDPSGHYTNAFGGTSSACPGVAGVAGLVLARNPDLRWDEVKDLLRRSCDRIDPSGGEYDQDGHSRFYGYGRVNAEKAVALAVPAVPARRTVHTIHQVVPIQDLKTSRADIELAGADAVKGVKIGVDIEHTYIGDLVIRLLPPGGRPPIVLHHRQGGGNKDLKTAYDMVNTPQLGALVGQSPAGIWTLEVEDQAKADEGQILSFSVELRFS